MPLVLTVPAAGAAVTATDIQTIADEAAAYTADIPAGDVDSTPAHAGVHAPAGADNLDGSYVGIGTGNIASGLIVRCAFRFTWNVALAEKGVIGYSIGAAVTLFASPGAGIIELTFVGMDITQSYLYALTQNLAGGAGSEPRIAAVREVAGNRLRILTNSAAGVALDLNNDDEFHVLVYEIVP